MTRCIWCERDLPYPATIPYIATGNKAICMRCVSRLNLIVVDQEKRGRLTHVVADVAPQSAIERAEESDGAQRG